MNDRELLELTYKASGHADKEILLLALKPLELSIM